LSGRFENDELRDRTLGGRTAKGTILEIRMSLLMVVMEMLGADRALVGRTELNQKRCAGCGHKSDGDIRAKYQRSQ
jgi:hypothetical protein